MPRFEPQDTIPSADPESALAEWVLYGARAASDLRIGSEHEKFLYDRTSLTPFPWEADSGRAVRPFLETLATEGGWQVVRSPDGVPYALSRANASVTLEPGGQIELSGAPLESLHAVAAETETFISESGALAARMGGAFLGLGAAPEWSLEAMPRVPKERYTIMRDYLPQQGTRALDMMHRTCTVQTNLDFLDEADLVRKFRAALALQPIITALYANSPFLNGRAVGFASERMRIWDDTDPARCAPQEYMFEAGAGLGDYVRAALEVPMFFVQREGRHLDASGQSFRAFMAGRLPALPGERARFSDWEDHLTTLFPPVRIKRWLELRGADGSCRELVSALSAVWVGLLYDAESLAEAELLASALDRTERDALRTAAMRGGLGARVSVPAAFVEAPAESSATRAQAMPRVETTLVAPARRLVAIAHAGLLRRARHDASGADETKHLEPLRHIAERGQSAAERRLALWQGPWGERFAPLYDDAAC